MRNRKQTNMKTMRTECETIDSLKSLKLKEIQNFMSETHAMLRLSSINTKRWWPSVEKKQQQWPISSMCCIPRQTRKYKTALQTHQACVWQNAFLFTHSISIVIVIKCSLIFSNNVSIGVPMRGSDCARCTVLHKLVNMPMILHFHTKPSPNGSLDWMSCSDRMDSTEWGGYHTRLSDRTEWNVESEMLISFWRKIQPGYVIHLAMIIRYKYLCKLNKLVDQWTKLHFFSFCHFVHCPRFPTPFRLILFFFCYFCRGFSN